MPNNLRLRCREWRALDFWERCAQILAHQYPLAHCFQCGAAVEPEVEEFFYDSDGTIFGGRTRNSHFCFWRSRPDTSEFLYRL